MDQGCSHRFLLNLAWPLYTTYLQTLARLGGYSIKQHVPNLSRRLFYQECNPNQNHLIKLAWCLQLSLSPNTTYTLTRLATSPPPQAKDTNTTRFFLLLTLIPSWSSPSSLELEPKWSNATQTPWYSDSLWIPTILLNTQQHNFECTQTGH